MSNPKFAETHNLVAFLEKPEESVGFEGIIDFLNASSIQYALTVNPTIYTSCIKQFWATAKTKTVNGEVHIQALVDGKKVIITETSIRRALHLKDAEGTDCLPTATIFAKLERMGAKTTAWNEFSSTMASVVILFLNKQVEGMNNHKEIFVIPSHSKKVFANMKREGKGFSGRDTPLFQSMMVQAPEDMGEDSEIPTDAQHTPILTQPSTSSQPQKKHKSRRKQRKEIEVPSLSSEIPNEESVPTPSNDPLPSDEDRMQLHELMTLCTNLQKQILDLEETKTAQAKEIVDLKKRVKKLERRKKSSTSGLKRLKKIGSARRIESSEESLGAQEDASKQGRKIADIDVDAEVNLTDETQSMNDDNLMFDTNILDDDETLIEIKAAKPKVITTAATTVTAVDTRSKGIVMQEPSETPSLKETISSC
ncbi:hypothetical protein Tco_0088776 [Tanacetum coccineum]